MTMRRSLNGALAGTVAAAVWAVQQPLDKRAFASGHDDVELLGKAVTRAREWPLIGLALHLGNGAAFGAVYAQLKPFIPGPPVLRGFVAGMVEHAASWPLARLVDRHHPARKDFTPLQGNARALAQSTWRHAIFGLVLGLLEERLNAELSPEPPEVPVSSNGQGDIEITAAVA